MVYHSDGESLNPVFASTSDAGNLPTNEADMYVGDFNGDNRNDIMSVYQDNSGSDFYLLENNKPVKINQDKVGGFTTLWDYALADYNGDGATDFVTLRYRGGESMENNPIVWSLYHSQEDSATLNSSIDLLTKHTNSLGGITSVNYQPSSDQDMTDGTMSNLHRLPFVLYLVHSVTLDDRVNNTGEDKATYTYEYSKGKYDFPTREFRGFENITKTDPLNIKTKSYYYQTREKKGRVREIRKYITSNENNGYFLSFQEYSIDTSSNVFTSLYLDYTKTAINKNSQDSQIKYVCNRYGEFGNTTQIATSESRQNGNCYTGIVSRMTYEHINNGTRGWIWRKKSESVHKKYKQNIENFKKKAEFGYDNKGNLTSKISYKDNVRNHSIFETYTYDNYGNQTKINDGEGKETTFTYDASKTYIAVKTLPAVGNITLRATYVYNTAYGKMESEKNVNDHITTYTYDNFGRPSSIDYPGSGSSITEVTKVYSNFSGNFQPSTVRTDVRNSASNSNDKSRTKEFHDGMGRVVQTLSSHTSQYTASRTDYDTVGRVIKVRGPVIVTTDNGLIAYNSFNFRSLC